jgi:general secretion pathway protein L
MAGIAQSVEVVGGGVSRFLLWWREELLGLLPRRTRSVATLLVAVGPNGYRIFEDQNGRPRSADAGADLAALDAVNMTAKLARSNPAAVVGIRVPLESCFVRHVELPRGAQDDAARILDLDLERATPFKLKDVYTAALVDNAHSSTGRLRVRHLVIKRESVEPILSELRASGVSIGFIDCWGDATGQALPVNFLASQQQGDASSGRVLSFNRALMLLAILAGAAAILLTNGRYQSAIETLESRIGEARTQATSVRRALDTSEAALSEIERLQAAKLGNVPTVEILNALTKLLPDSVWLTDLRLEGGLLDITGLAQSSAALLPLFERSTLFADAAMTSAVNFDQQENKERFGLRVRIRQPGEPAANKEKR